MIDQTIRTEFRSVVAACCLHGKDIKALSGSRFFVFRRVLSEIRIIHGLHVMLTATIAPPRHFVLFLLGAEQQRFLYFAPEFYRVS